MTGENAIGFGLIGCGAFGNFCLDQFREMDNVRLIGVTDTVPELARQTGSRLGLTVFDSVDDLLAEAAIDLVHLATPPKTHHSLDLQALDRGKHVLCEKPLATRREHATEMMEAARRQQCILAVNLMMRYNPL